LSTLLHAVGDLKEVGRTADGKYQAAWNTDAESLNNLKNHAEGARRIIVGGISGIGELLWRAADNDIGEIPAGTLSDIGVLLRELAEALYPLDNLEYRFANSRPAPKNRGGHG
jgi:hypothetical protein